MGKLEVESTETACRISHWGFNLVSLNTKIVKKHLYFWSPSLSPHISMIKVYVILEPNYL